MHVSIAVVGEDGEEDPNKRSQIVISKPFLHDLALFESWRDFFEKCVQAEGQVQDEDKQAKMQRQGCSGSLRGTSGSNVDSVNKGAMARPCLNVEYKGKVDMETLKSICPFVVKKALYPGLPEDFTTAMWKTNLYCPRTGHVDMLEDAEKKHSLAIQDAVTLE
jgi:hypothetical protein